MKIFLLIIVIANSLALQLKAQEIKRSQLDLMQGIWENTMNTDSEHSYTIIIGMYTLNFVFSSVQNALDFPLSESVEGFQNDDSGDNDSINIKSLKENGINYTVIDKKYINKNGWVHRPNYLTPEYFECDGENMSINGGQLVEYTKIKRLPNTALKMLYYRGKQDKRNYIKEYLGIEVKEIKVDKCTIYSDPEVATKMYLIKGDVVTVLKEMEGWLSIEYLGAKLVKGWIRKQDTR